MLNKQKIIGNSNIQLNNSSDNEIKIINYGGLIELIHQNTKNLNFDSLKSNIDSMKRMIDVSDDFELLFDVENSGKFKLRPKNKLHGGKVFRGRIVFEIPEKYKHLNNINEICKYSYYKQIPITLKTVLVEISVASKVIKIFESELKSNKTSEANFVTDIGMDIDLGDLNFTDEIVSSEITLQPQEFPEGITVNIDNEQYESLLNNIEIRLEEIEEKDNQLIYVFSNKHQESNPIYLKIPTKFELESSGKYVFIKSSFEFQPRDHAMSYHNLCFSLLQLKILEAQTITICDSSTGDMVFRGNFLDIDIENAKNLIRFWKSIYFIEKNISIKIATPKIITERDFKEVLLVSKIIREGILIRKSSSNLSLSIRPESLEYFKQFIEKSVKNSISICIRRPKAGIELFETKLLTTSQIVILTECNLKNADEILDKIEEANEDKSLELELSFQARSQIIEIYPQYYGSDDVKRIIEKEKIHNVNHNSMLTYVEGE